MRRMGGQRGDVAVRLFLAVVLLLGAIGFVAIRLNGNAGRVPGGTTRNDPAPELRRIDAWINSAPLTLRDLRVQRRVVLIDFWTFSCINCLRTFPGLKALYERYKPAGLEIVGVHSPEFRFERDERNVRDAVRRYGVTWPVCLDNDMATWRAFANNYWPHVYLIDRDGAIRYDKVGEGDEAELEIRLRALLAEDGTQLPSPVAIPEPAFAPGMTPEVYAGYLRGEPNDAIANAPGYVRDKAHEYDAPGERTLANAPGDGRFYLQGSWLARAERLEARGAGRVLLPFVARDVFIVASSPDQEATVRLTLDGRPLRYPGADMQDGAVRVREDRLYALVRLPSSGRHVLTLDVPAGFAFYTFTFG